MNWLLPIILATSLSVRSPNIDPNPFDYQIQFAIQKSDYFYVSRCWERELGIEYIDEEYWTQKRLGNFSVKERYLNKTSKDLKYNQLDVRYNHKEFNGGYALKHIESELKPTHNLVIGYKIKDKNLDIFILKFRLNSNLDFATNFNRLDISTNTNLKFSLLQNLDLVASYKYESIGSNEFYQLKLGLSFEISGKRK